MTETSVWSMELAELTKAINHPVRIQILSELTIGSRIVSELLDHLMVEPSLLSKHLAVLREAGLVECEIEWRCRRYNLRKPQVVKNILAALSEAVRGSTV